MNPPPSDYDLYGDAISAINLHIRDCTDQDNFRTEMRECRKVVLFLLLLLAPVAVEFYGMKGLPRQIHQVLGFHQDRCWRAPLYCIQPQSLRVRSNNDRLRSNYWKLEKNSFCRKLFSVGIVVTKLVDNKLATIIASLFHLLLNPWSLQHVSSTLAALISAPSFSRRETCSSTRPNAQSHALSSSSPMCAWVQYIPEYYLCHSLQR